MQDFVEAAKRAAASAADRATWEANRMRRSGSRQREVDLSQRERTALLEQIGTIVLDLEHRGQLAPDPLVALARRLRTLDAEIASGLAEVQSIRTETYTPGAGPHSGTSGGSSAKGPSAARPQPPRPAARPVTIEAEHPCPSCGKSVRDNAAFCPSCGARQPA
ncbi:MAG TPA: zinc ribbon domain-containing protein [Ktedonobacterales bacterium]|jgi:hypothetical protein